MDPMTGMNRGYAFVTFTTRDEAHEAVRQVKQSAECLTSYLTTPLTWGNHVYRSFILKQTWIYLNCLDSNLEMVFRRAKFVFLSCDPWINAINVSISYRFEALNEINRRMSFIFIFRVLKLIDFSFSPLRRFLLQLDSYEIGEGKTLKLNVSEPKTRLFIGNIPKSKGRDEIEEEFKKLSGKVSCVSRRVYLFLQSKSKILFSRIVSCF